MKNLIVKMTNNAFSSDKFWNKEIPYVGYDINPSKK